MSNVPELLLSTRRFRVVRHRLTATDGSAVVKESIQHPGAVAILPLLELPRRVVLIRNYRVAVGQELIEIPAGTLDRDEPLEATAMRELAEETGYRAEQWQKIGELLMSPGILHERMHLFLAQGLTAGAAALEPGEEIETLIVPWGEALAMCSDGRIIDAKTIAAIFMADRQIGWP